MLPMLDSEVICWHSSPQWGVIVQQDSGGSFAFFASGSKRESIVRNYLITPADVLGLRVAQRPMAT
jgi:hypothetical protein